MQPGLPSRASAATMASQSSAATEPSTACAGCAGSPTKASKAYGANPKNVGGSAGLIATVSGLVPATADQDPGVVKQVHLTRPQVPLQVNRR